MIAGTNESYPEERPEDMDPDEPDGITSPLEASSAANATAAPPGAVTKSRLQNLEQNLLKLERTYGATHPQVRGASLCMHFALCPCMCAVAYCLIAANKNVWRLMTCGMLCNLRWTDSICLRTSSIPSTHTSTSHVSQLHVDGDLPVLSRLLRILTVLYFLYTLMNWASGQTQRRVAWLPCMPAVCYLSI